MTKAVLGGGCFWCLDAIFRKVDGVKDVICGYAGGRRPNPNYEQVCTGVTGHAEVVMIKFDETKISFDKIVDIFFEIHNPTELNRQGNDIGTQYRSIILYLDEKQKEIAISKIEELKKNGINIVTEIKKLEKFYEAEEYHQNYFAKNPYQPYCQYLISPKVKSFSYNYDKKGDK
jgi:peptide-methionine (S)-S-oxide reductase